MRWKRSLWSLGVGLTLASRSLFAAEDAPEFIPGPKAPAALVSPYGSCVAPSKPPCVVPPIMPPAVGEPSRPGEVTPPDQQRQVPPDLGAVQPGAGDAFAQAPEAGTAGGAGSFNPTMFGDFISSRFIFVPPDPMDIRAAASSGPSALNDGDEAVRVLIPEVAKGAFKIADNESPRPLDRVYINTNFFSVQGIPGTTNRIDIYREILGAEKTFLDGNASIGIRVPFFQVHTSIGPGLLPGGGASAIADNLNESAVGDLTFIGKYAFINNCETGNVLAGGLAVTAPTGPTERIAVPTAISSVSGFGLAGTPISTFTLHDTLLQPFVGGIFNCGNLYFHGFTSVLVPTDSRDVTYLFNDYGVGYFVIRRGANDCDRLLTALVPTFEVHVNDALRHNGSTSVPIGGIDLIDLTAGVTVGLGRRCWWSFGYVTPVTGPRPFQYELQSFLNVRF
jgi:hypothetical protein